MHAKCTHADLHNMHTKSFVLNIRLNAFDLVSNIVSNIVTSFGAAPWPNLAVTASSNNCNKSCLLFNAAN